MQRLLIIGCGDIALRAAHLLVPRYRVFGLSRSPQRHPLLRSRGITPIAGDLDIPSSLSRLAGLAHTVLHFAPPQNFGSRDRRTANLLGALAKCRMLPHRLVYISSSGVYGDCAGGLVPETHPLLPTTARALRRADAEAKLREWGRSNRVNVCILRVPGIYAAGRLPLERLNKAIPVLVNEDDIYTNHIHADDLARVVVAALRYARPCRIYNAGDDTQMKMGDYFDLVADRFRLPRPPRVSREAAPELIPEALRSFMEESRRLVNRRMKRELRVKLRYPSAADGIAAALRSELE